MTSTTPTDLEIAMETIMLTFYKYAGKDGKCNSLNRREFKDLLEKELPSFIKTQKDPATVDKMMKDLDVNGDGEISCEEYASLMAGLTNACGQCYEKHLENLKKQYKK